MAGHRADIKHNRFDALRLLFAALVLVYHMSVLSRTGGAQAQAVLARAAELSIEGFFIISGFLVYGSLQRSKALKLYAEKRVRRLYPAYFVVVLIPALVSLISLGLGGAEAGGEAGQEVLRYLAANLVFLNFLHPTLPGLFAHNPVPVVNGALWTLKIEVMFYMVLPVLGWVLAKSGRGKWVLLILIYSAAELWRLGIVRLDIPHAAQIARQLPGQMSFFAAGMGLWLMRDRLLDKSGLLLLAGLVITGLSLLPPLIPLRALGLGALVYGLAFMPGPRLNAARFGDFSYGLYILHFPIINALVALGLFGPPVWRGWLLAPAVVLLASAVLWHLVEKPFLRRSSHYRQSEDHRTIAKP